VKNTKKITKAMELVAAAKMKRAVASTLRSRVYAEYSSEILASIARNKEEIAHPLFREREAKELIGKTLFILITSNRGLCGAYNAQVIKKSLPIFRGAKVDVITVGKKGDVAVRRVGENVLASFFELPDNISLADVSPISDLALGEYRLGKYDKVFIAYTDFVSALTQRPNIKQILPISKDEIRKLQEGGSQKIDYLFEGDEEELIVSLAEKITKMQIYQMLLESGASEQSARMVAMKNASEASGEMIDDLTLVFNKARQSNITREISEISAGMASVS
jgi:F-type H+-transporting ATPase subunit gamma